MRKLTIASVLLIGFSTVFASTTPDITEKEIKSETKTSTASVTHSIQGQILDKLTGEALAGVVVEIEGVSKKYYTDFDGNFIISNVNPGVYNVNLKYLSYENIQLKEVNAKASATNIKVEMESVSPEF